MIYKSSMWNIHSHAFIFGQGPMLGRTKPYYSYYCREFSAIHRVTSIVCPRPFLVVRVDHASQDGFLVDAGKNVVVLLPANLNNYTNHPERLLFNCSSFVACSRCLDLALRYPPIFFKRFLDCWI